MFLALSIVFFGVLIGLIWDLFGEDEDLRDEIEKDLNGWWEYFNDDDDDDQDDVVNGD